MKNWEKKKRYGESHRECLETAPQKRTDWREKRKRGEARRKKCEIRTEGETKSRQAQGTLDKLSTSVTHVQWQTGMHYQDTVTTNRRWLIIRRLGCDSFQQTTASFVLLARLEGPIQPTLPRPLYLHPSLVLPVYIFIFFAKHSFIAASSAKLFRFVTCF